MATPKKINRAALNKLGLVESTPAQPRTPEPKRKAGMPPRQTWDVMQRLVAANPDSEPAWLYDTLIVGPAQMPGSTGAFPFASWAKSVSFFNERTVANATEAITNVADVNKLAVDFVASSIQVEVAAYPDAAAAAGSSAALDFVHTITTFGILAFKRGSTGRYILIAPVSRFPAAGGTALQVRQRTQTIATNTEIGFASNGLPSPQSKIALRKPFVLQQGQSFSCELMLPESRNGAQGAVNLIKGLQAIAGDYNAMIRVTLEGIRGGDTTEGKLRGVSIEL